MLGWYPVISPPNSLGLSQVAGSSSHRARDSLEAYCRSPRGRFALNDMWVSYALYYIGFTRSFSGDFSGELGWRNGGWLEDKARFPSVFWVVSSEVAS